MLNKPVHRLIGRANRQRIGVYTRVGEGRNLEEARKRARDLYDRGHKHQKWYFVYGPSGFCEGTCGSKIAKVNNLHYVFIGDEDG